MPTISDMLRGYWEDAKWGGSLNPELPKVSTGDVSNFAQDMSPVWGGMKGAKEEFDQGNYGWSAFNAATVPMDMMSFGVLGTTAKGLAKALRAGKKLPMDVLSRTQRATDMGYDMDDVYYHATKQDFDEFQPVYDDGLVFVTPQKEFANDWIGKGARQERIGDVAKAEREAVEAEKKRIRQEYNEKMQGVDDEDVKSQLYDEYYATIRRLNEGERNIHGAVYPVVTRANKTFNPETDIEVRNELMEKFMGKNTDDMEQWSQVLAKTEADSALLASDFAQKAVDMSKARDVKGLMALKKENPEEYARLTNLMNEYGTTDLHYIDRAINQATAQVADPSVVEAYRKGGYLMYENKDVVDFLKDKGYDSMWLRESSWDYDKPFSTKAIFDPTKIRSTNAEFDPAKIDSANILSSVLRGNDNYA